jgi:hypothetical protein
MRVFLIFGVRVEFFIIANFLSFFVCCLLYGVGVFLVSFRLFVLRLFLFACGVGLSLIS